MKRLALLLALAMMPAAGARADGPDPHGTLVDCPGVRCRSYRIRDCYLTRCLAGTSVAGRIDIPFMLGDPPPTAAVTKSEFLGSVLESTRTWERVSPVIDFRFVGWSSTQPLPLDGVRTIGFSILGVTGLATAHHWAEVFPDANPSEWDVSITPGPAWTWSRCTGSCPPAKGDLDIQAILTHELGHVLGLDHPPGTPGQIVDMTMNTGTAPNEGGLADRRKSSLALGDMLGVRELYPFSCPRGKDGRKLARSRVPARYKQVCPTYIVYSP